MPAGREGRPEECPIDSAGRPKIATNIGQFVLVAVEYDPRNGRVRAHSAREREDRMPRRERNLFEGHKNSGRFTGRDHDRGCGYEGIRERVGRRARSQDELPTRFIGRARYRGARRRVATELKAGPRDEVPSIWRDAVGVLHCLGARPVRGRSGVERAHRATGTTRNACGGADNPGHWSPEIVYPKDGVADDPRPGHGLITVKDCPRDRCICRNGSGKGEHRLTRRRNDGEQGDSIA